MSKAELSSEVTVYGKEKPYVGKEIDMQISTAKVISFARNKYKDLLAYHVPNEGKRAARPGKTIKHQGAQSGVPDWYLFKMSSDWKAAYIELKVAKGELLPTQIAFLNEASSKGVRCFVVWSLAGFDQALKDLGIFPFSDGWASKVKF